MKVQLIRDYRRLKCGQFAVMDDGVANVLIRRKICRNADTNANDASSRDNSASDGASDDPGSPPASKPVGDRHRSRRKAKSPNGIGS